jgi:hypothetical protein
MFTGRQNTTIHATNFHKRNFFNFVRRRFQIKYTLTLIVSVGIGLTVFAGPVLHFSDQNYKIFIGLAYKHAPELIGDLENEQKWIKTFLVLSGLGVLLVYGFLGIFITSRFYGPLSLLEKHMRQITKGKWDLPLIKMRSDDEFHELIEVYNYFYESFRASTKAELSALRKMRINMNSGETYALWCNLIKIKEEQLNHVASHKINDASAAPSLDLHRAS